LAATAAIREIAIGLTSDRDSRANAGIRIVPKESNVFKRELKNILHFRVKAYGRQAAWLPLEL
jgi:hypothetical protein